MLTHLDAEGLGYADIARLGYAMPTGENQLDTLPWTNIDTISIVFSEDVNVDQDDLALWGVNVADYVGEVGFAVDGFSYDSNTFTATWTLAAPIAADKLMIDLNADIGGVTDISGNLLDGEWEDGVSTTSGNSEPGGDFRFRFNVLPGDVDGNGMTISDDLALVRDALGTVVGDEGYLPGLDVNGDGMIISNDLVLVRNQLGAALPDEEPAVPRTGRTGAYRPPVFGPLPAMAGAARRKLVDPREGQVVTAAAGNERSASSTAAPPLAATTTSEESSPPATASSAAQSVAADARAGFALHESAPPRERTLERVRIVDRVFEEAQPARRVFQEESSWMLQFDGELSAVDGDATGEESREQVWAEWSEQERWNLAWQPLIGPEKAGSSVSRDEIQPAPCWFEVEGKREDSRCGRITCS